MDKDIHEMRLGPEFRAHAARVLADRGASPASLEAARFFRLPGAASCAALPYLEDRSIPVRGLLATIEERAERSQGDQVSPRLPQGRGYAAQRNFMHHHNMWSRLRRAGALRTAPKGL